MQIFTNINTYFFYNTKLKQTEDKDLYLEMPPFSSTAANGFLIDKFPIIMFLLFLGIESPKKDKTFFDTWEVIWF